MPDVFAFRAVRSPRRAEPDVDAIMRLAWTEDLTPVVTTANQPNKVAWGNGPFLAKLVAILDDTSIIDKYAAAETAAESYLNQADAIDEDMIEKGIDPTLGPTTGTPYPGQEVLGLIDRVDRWLVAHDDRPDPDDLDGWLANAIRGGLSNVSSSTTDAKLLDQTLEDRRWFGGAFAPPWERLVDALAAALLIPARFELAQRLTRLLLVVGLVDRRSQLGETIPADDAWKLLAHRIPLLPDRPFPAVLPDTRVRLVRQATVSDLFVVRQEWQCYVAAEIADIRNILAGEKHEQTTTRLDEREVTQIEATATVSTEETSSEFGEESAFSEQTSRAMGLALHADAQVDVMVEYGPVSVDAAAGFSADFSLSESTNRATQITKRAVSRAATKVESQVRRERIERLLTRSEDIRHRSVDNTSGANARGIYRWVNRIDRLQVWRYPDRLQLEFQIPEPGRFSWRNSRS